MIQAGSWIWWGATSIYSCSGNGSRGVKNYASRLLKTIQESLSRLRIQIASQLQKGFPQRNRAACLWSCSMYWATFRIRKKLARSSQIPLKCVSVPQNLGSCYRNFLSLDLHPYHLVQSSSYFSNKWRLPSLDTNKDTPSSAKNAYHLTSPYRNLTWSNGYGGWSFSMLEHNTASYR